MNAPLERKYADLLRTLGAGIDSALNGAGPREVVFALLVAEVGSEGRVNYISTADRSDMLSMMREFIARAEGAFPAPGGRA